MPVKSKSKQLSKAKLTRDGRSGLYAVVDIGSNSVRLVVYDRLGRAPVPRFNEKSLCRLADGLAETSELSEESCRRTIEAMRRFRAIADAMKVDRIDSIATEAVRRASNGAQLLARITKEAGFKVQVLSGAEEARFASLGVLAGFYQPSGLVGDMGGGSLEIAEIGNKGVGDFSASMPLGALPVQALLADPREEAKQRVDAILSQNLPRGLSRPIFFAVGGGWRAFARVHLASGPASLRVVNGTSHIFLARGAGRSAVFAAAAGRAGTRSLAGGSSRLWRRPCAGS
jgi:exopolyphosphatase/guanosine-5'-triphosphate,3'-diphosphate pyrophosphatase